MKEFNLEKIQFVISNKYNWGTPDKWTNFHFVKLSKLILEITGERLSEETLKRIFGKRKISSEKYQPQVYTQMVLIRFTEEISQTDIKKLKYKAFKRVITKRNTYLAFLIFTGGLLFLFISGTIRNSEDYWFYCENPVDFTPYTASIRYNVSEISDSVFADFGIQQETFLPPDRNLYNHFYKKTGIYSVRFYTRSKMLDSLIIYACSNNWEAGSFPNYYPEKYVPFHNQDFYRLENYFYGSPELLENEGMSISKRDWITYKYIYPFGENLDDLTLETRVINNQTTGSLICCDIEIVMSGDSGQVIVRFTQSKCNQFSRLRVSEKYMSGRFADLSMLSVDLSDWLDIRFITKNKSFLIYLSDKLIHRVSYTNSMGNLNGIIYNFFGTGKIDYLELKDSIGNPFYINNFSLENREN